MDGTKEGIIPFGDVIRMLTNAENQIIAVLAFLIRRLSESGSLDLDQTIAFVQHIRKEWPDVALENTYALDLLVQYLGTAGSSSPSPNDKAIPEWLKGVIEGGLAKKPAAEPAD